MNKNISFNDFLAATPCILGEGAIIERLRRNPALSLDPHLVNAAFIYRPAERAAQAGIIRQYLDIGRNADLPMLISTPTWRAGKARCAAAGYDDRDVNGDNCRFLAELVGEYGDYANQVLICGLMSCHGDAYKPAEALSAHESQQLHLWQAEKLVAGGVDFILAATLPALSEAVGLARAAAATGAAYVISFVVRPEGTLLDGTPLTEAIATIDGAASPQPTAYMLNCCHVSIARAALLHPANSSDLVRRRVIGLLANTAALSPEELNDNAVLVEEEPLHFGITVATLQQELGLKIVGGCCGTDDRHIRALAEKLTTNRTRSIP